MEARVTEWKNRLEAVTKAVQAEFGDLHEEKLNWKPDEKTWSIAQNLDHLITLNASYYPVLEAALAGEQRLPWTAKVGFLRRFFGKMILNSVEPQRTKKMRTFPIWEPKKSELPGTIVADFVAHQQQFWAALEQALPLLDRRTVIASPANANIIYELPTFFDIVITHEERHLNQAREVLANLPK